MISKVPMIQAGESKEQNLGSLRELHLGVHLDLEYQACKPVSYRRLHMTSSKT